MIPLLLLLKKGGRKENSTKEMNPRIGKVRILKIISLPAGFVTKQIMIRQIVGTVESQSAIIATNLGTLRRIADSRKQTKQIFLKARMMMMEMKTCSLLVYLPLRKKESIWYLDSGCSNHMSGNENIFLNVDTSATPNIKMGNGAIVEAKGKGRIAVKTKKGLKQIHDVLLVLKLSQNLLSVGQLVENGYRLVFQDGACIIYDKNAVEMVIARVKMERNRNFPIEFQYAEVAAMKADVVQDSWLWHKRFCHLNFQGLKLLQKNSMVNGLLEIKETTDVCEGCIMGKQHRNSFRRQSTWRAKAPLELIHTNICGKMQTPSLSQYKYFILTFIDDFSRMTWVYFLKEKSETLVVFKRFKALVEKQSGSTIKVMRSDRGGEYTFQEFEDYCKDEGIWKQLTASYSPEPNGIAERENRTIVEMATSMMNEKGLPKHFWAEAVFTAVYILNRSPTKVVKNKTPFEAWSGFKPS
ncbi:unnamed protein product, partial [Prunus brigantina]